MDFKEMLVKDVLPAIGLRQKNPVLPMVGAFGAGLLVGYGVKYLLESEGAHRLYEDASRRIKDTFSSATGSEEESSERESQSRRAS